MIAVLDFVVGSFVHVKPEFGITGYSVDNFQHNFGPDFPSSAFIDDNDSPIENNFTIQADSTVTTETVISASHGFFIVLGIFLPSATGVFSGINMATDLKEPKNSIPTGTYAAIASSAILYSIFIFILACTCNRFYLQIDNMITEKISGTGILFLIGLYTSSISSGMGCLYGAPRILQYIARDQPLSFISHLGKGYSNGDVPIISLACIGVVSLTCVILGGQINSLSPFAALPFIFTYAAVNASNFAINCSEISTDDVKPVYGTIESYSEEPQPAKKGDGIMLVFMAFEKYLSLIGVFLSLTGMFLIDWIISIFIVFSFLIICLVVRRTNPNSPQGLVKICLVHRIKKIASYFVRGGNERLIVMPNELPGEVGKAQFDDVSLPEDYNDRPAYHQAKPLNG